MTGLPMITINERETDPLSEYVSDFLFGLKKECAYLDYKWFIDLSKNSEDFAKTMKHVLAFSNYGCGWIMLGWKEIDKTLKPVGLPENFSADQAVIQEKVNSYLEKPLEVHYKEFYKEVDNVKKRFALIFIPPSKEKLIPIKDGVLKAGEKLKTMFTKGELLFRRGSQSINPSEDEISYIENRIKDYNYKLSVLSGEPDLIEETLYSNLFEVIKMPEFVYLGKKKEIDNVSIKVFLKSERIFPEWIFKFLEYAGQIVLFENLENSENPYRKIVDVNSIKKERVTEWLSDVDKKKIIISLLKKELLHLCFEKDLFYFEYKNQFFFPAIKDTDERAIEWLSKTGRKSSRIVAKKSYANQINGFVYYHHCFSGNIIEIEKNKFYYEIVPSFLITRDGRRPFSNFSIGTFITRLAYSQFNDKYLNNILFWMYTVSEGSNIRINDYLEISCEPVTIKLDKGIR